MPSQNDDDDDDDGEEKEDEFVHGSPGDNGSVATGLETGNTRDLAGSEVALIKGRKGEDCGWATKEAGEPPIKRISLSATTRITVRRDSTVLASLCWDRREELDSYIVQVLEDEHEWAISNKISFTKREAHYFAWPLKPSTTYRFHVKGKDAYGRRQHGLRLSL